VAKRDGTTYTIKPAPRGDRRLTEIRDCVGLAVGGVDLVVIEDVVVRSPAAAVIGMVHGAVRAALLEWGISYAVVAPASLKKFATGRGNAGKPEMAVALFKRVGLELADDNQVDAWWLRAAGHQMLGAPLVELPAAQVAALEAVSR
jgi:Holliday junction resolvasome RuvABC endonuclease subunit